jgi:hypothetical protein
MPRPSCKFLNRSHNPGYCSHSVAVPACLYQDCDIAMRTVLFCALAPYALHSLHVRNTCSRHKADLTPGQPMTLVVLRRKR